MRSLAIVYYLCIFISSILHYQRYQYADMLAQIILNDIITWCEWWLPWTAINGSGTDEKLYFMKMLFICRTQQFNLVWEIRICTTTRANNGKKRTRANCTKWKGIARNNAFRRALFICLFCSVQMKWRWKTDYRRWKLDGTNCDDEKEFLFHFLLLFVASCTQHFPMIYQFRLLAVPFIGWRVHAIHITPCASPFTAYLIRGKIHLNNA